MCARAGARARVCLFVQAYYPKAGVNAFQDRFLLQNKTESLCNEMTVDISFSSVKRF